MHYARRLVWGADRTKCSKLHFGHIRVAAVQVRKAGGTCGEGLRGKDYRDGQFGLLLDPTTSVGGEARVSLYFFT